MTHIDPAALQAIVGAAADEHGCPPIAWGVVVDGEVVAGQLTDRVRRIASMTKSFTAAAVLALRDEGLLSLDVPVAEYAPELAPVRGPDRSPAISLRHLLSMSSGLATDDPWADRHLDMSPTDIDRVYADGPLFARPTGSGFEYSNLGYGMIGRVVERATGTRLQQHVTDRFLRPLGMHDTTWVEPAADRWDPPFRRQDDATVPDPHHPIGDGEISPMGGLWTTVDDLARWTSFLDGEAPPVGTLSTASRREMASMHTWVGMITIAGRAGPAGYGFGLRQFVDPELGPLVDHSGGLPGYGSNMRWAAGRGVAAIALSNLTYAPMSELTMQLLVEVHRQGGMPNVLPPAAPLLNDAAMRLVALLSAWNDHDADRLFADNVAPDEHLDRRRRQAAALVDRHGALELVRVEPVTEARGAVVARGAASGEELRITVMLAPLADGTVQHYSVVDNTAAPSVDD